MYRSKLINIVYPVKSNRKNKLFQYCLTLVGNLNIAISFGKVEMTRNKNTHHIVEHILS